MSTVKFFSNNCTDENWKTRPLTDDEIVEVENMCKGYKNVTVTGIHFSANSVEVNFSVNYLSTEKFPNNHREYAAFKSLTVSEWQGWH